MKNFVPQKIWDMVVSTLTRVFLLSVLSVAPIGLVMYSFEYTLFNASFLNFGRSYINLPGTTGNAVRFSIEAQTSIIDERNNQTIDYYVSSPMQRENTFAVPPLFDVSTRNNADFIPVFDSTGKHVVLFRRWAEARPGAYRQTATATEVWGEPMFKLHEQHHIRRLQNFIDIANASAEGFPILARVKVWNENDARLYSYIEFPVKTLNVISSFSPEYAECLVGKTRCWQVDTGLVLFPDLEQYDSYEPKINSLGLAYIAFNTFDSVDVVIDEEKPNLDNANVYQFSKEIVNRQAEVTLFAVADYQYFLPNILFPP